MEEKSKLVDAALEMSAKYICTFKCGRCPIVEEEFSCPVDCNLETQAWHCWKEFFMQRAVVKVISK